MNAHYIPYLIPSILVLLAGVYLLLARKSNNRYKEDHTTEEQLATESARNVDIDPADEPVPSSIFDATPSGTKIPKSIGPVSSHARIRNNACYEGALTEEQLRALTKALDAGCRHNPSINDLDTVWRDAPRSNSLRTKSGTQPTVVGGDHHNNSKNGTNGTTH